MLRGRSALQGSSLDVQLHAAAPPKPAYGAACNGCGLCCAVATCPLGIILFHRIKGPCPALLWQDGRYACGVLAQPDRFAPRLPRRWAARLVARWIAAGKGCDCRTEVDDAPQASKNLDQLQAGHEPMDPASDCRE